MTQVIQPGFYIDPNDDRFLIPYTREAWANAVGYEMRPISVPQSYRLRIDGKTRKPALKSVERNSVTRNTTTGE